MTRKDYVALAEALNHARPQSPRSYGGAQWDLDVRYVADVLAADNPRFDRERFIKACQGEKS